MVQMVTKVEKRYKALSADPQAPWREAMIKDAIRQTGREEGERSITSTHRILSSAEGSENQSQGEGSTQQYKGGSSSGDHTNSADRAQGLDRTAKHRAIIAC